MLEANSGRMIVEFRSNKKKSRRISPVNYQLLPKGNTRKVETGHRPTLDRGAGLFLHIRCIPLQNSQWQFWASVLLMAARHDDMSPSGNTCLVRIRNNRLDRRIDSFNLVIHLRKVKQLAFFHFSPVGRVSVATTVRCAGLQFLLAWCICDFAAESSWNLFCQLCSGDRPLSFHITWKRGASHACSYGGSFFLWSLVRSNCASNSFDYFSRPEGCDLNLESLEPDHEPTHVMLWMYHFIKLSPLVPNFMRAPLSM